jgi:hypothetical protein
MGNNEIRDEVKRIENIKEEQNVEWRLNWIR